MQQFLITDVVTKQTRIADLTEALHLAQMSGDDLEMMLAEHGIYETIRHTVVEIIVLSKLHKRTPT
jgi:hypothetical protein